MALPSADNGTHTSADGRSQDAPSRECSCVCSWAVSISLKMRRLASADAPSQSLEVWGLSTLVVGRWVYVPSGMCSFGRQAMPCPALTLACALSGARLCPVLPSRWVLSCPDVRCCRACTYTQRSTIEPFTRARAHTHMQVLASVERYNSEAGGWEEVANMTMPRAAFHLLLLPTPTDGVKMCAVAGTFFFVFTLSPLFGMSLFLVSFLSLPLRRDHAAPPPPPAYTHTHTRDDRGGTSRIRGRVRKESNLHHRVVQPGLGCRV